MLSFAKPAQRYILSVDNDERMAFICDAGKVTLLEEIGEIALPPSQLGKVTLKSTPSPKLEGFDRNPYLASLQLGRDLAVQLVNLHLYVGADRLDAKLRRRAVGTAAVARRCDLRRKSSYSRAREIIALEDFTLPKDEMHGGNVVSDAPTAKSRILPARASRVVTDIASGDQYD